jgi:glyoxylase-like metal-dependent hydrolase (beta-lactamase superfamily II)
VPVRAHPLTAERLRGTIEVEGSLEDGVVRTLPGRPGWRLRVVHTPGHAPGHISLFEEVSKSLLAGDVVAGAGFIVIDPPEGNMTQYLDSLRKLDGLGASVIFPSHGGPTAGVRERFKEYLDHRLEREGRVIAALDRDSGRSIEEILPVVYADVDPALHPLASRSLLAHLEKLVAEGRVGKGEGGWFLK